jgi:predicted acyl esterase
VSRTSLDRPGKRPGAFRYALQRLGGFLWPPVSVGEAPAGLVRELDVDVPTRDGTRLEVNVHRPAEPGRFAVVLSAHAHGKDNLPLRKRFGYAVPWEYRRLRLSEPISFSRMTSWRAPDPGYWVDAGYAVVNADLRGTGASDGEPNPGSDQEGEDVADLVAWCARQPWSNGSVGLLGVSCPRVAPVPELKAAVAWDDIDIDVDAPTLIGVGGLSSFYSDEALAAQLQFLDRHLRDRLR